MHISPIAVLLSASRHHCRYTLSSNIGHYTHYHNSIRRLYSNNNKHLFNYNIMEPSSSKCGNDHYINQDALNTVPKEKRISVVYYDSSIIVINKPPKLRSVPGHAASASSTIYSSAMKSSNEIDKDPNIWKDTPQLRGSPPIGDKKRKHHETWAYALHETANDLSEKDVAGSVTINGLIKSLAALPNSSVVPRKRRTFIRYCVRTNTRLINFENHEGSLSKVPSHEERRLIVEKIAEKAFTKIYRCQQPMLNLPTPTKDNESALGQLRLLGFELSPEVPIKAVHRLDMETSGVMVFARNDQAASKLCEAWRERDLVDKLYLAQVNRWPPFHTHGLKEGSIDLALAPSKERLKWKVQEDGKPSKTLWEVLHTPLPDEIENVITLSLKPITGRTHQLRIHCASIGSGIIGDSLYGDNPVEWTEDVSDKSSVLRLHASKLSIPHPETSKVLSFETLPNWYPYK